MPPSYTVFDPATRARMFGTGHFGAIGGRYVDHGADWCRFALDWREELVGDPGSGVLASGPIVTLLDVAVGTAFWLRLGRFSQLATLDLHVDYLRAARPRHAVVARGECYKTTRAIGFARGFAYDEDERDPIAHIAATLMLTDAAT